MANDPEPMAMVASRWEFGGELPLLREGEPVAPAGARLDELLPNARLFGTGRAALLVLFAHGQRERGWRRLLLPSYLCPEIPQALEAAGVPFATYADAPDARPAGLPSSLEPGD